MGLFSKLGEQHIDLRDRDYVLTGTPLVAEDNLVLAADLTVRFTVRGATEDRPRVLGYDPTDEPALHAVILTVLRLTANTTPSHDLLTSRRRVSDAIEQALGFAPVAAGVDARVVSVEVRPHDGALAERHEFRVVSSAQA